MYRRRNLREVNVGCNRHGDNSQVDTNEMWYNKTVLYYTG